MNKLLKGAIAGAAGVALLLGGAGTFALWNQSTTVVGGTVNSGVLTIANSVGPTWKNLAPDAVNAGAIPAIASYKIVPGDKLELTQVVTINATGDNLAATLSFDETTIAAAGAANIALKDASVINLTATGAGITSLGGNKFSVTPNGTGTSAVTLKLTVELPSTVSNTVAQGGSLDLTALKFNLDQNVR